MSKKKEFNVKDVLKQFEQSEKAASNRKGGIKIGAPFEEAVKKILKAKPESRRPGRKGGKVDSHSKSGD